MKTQYKVNYLKKNDKKINKFKKNLESKIPINQRKVWEREKNYKIFLLLLIVFLILYKKLIIKKIWGLLKKLLFLIWNKKNIEENKYYKEIVSETKIYKLFLSSYKKDSKLTNNKKGVE